VGVGDCGTAAFFGCVFFATVAVVVARADAVAARVRLAETASVAGVTLSVVVCAGTAFLVAFRTAPARSAMAIPHIKTGARRGAAHSEDGKNTEPMVWRQTCHTSI
jgi:hypothetical protein